MSGTPALKYFTTTKLPSPRVMSFKIKHYQFGDGTVF